MTTLAVRGSSGGRLLLYVAATSWDRGSASPSRPSRYVQYMTCSWTAAPARAAWPFTWWSKVCVCGGCWMLSSCFLVREWE